MKKVVIVNDTRSDGHYGCYAVMEAVVTIISRLGMEIIHSQAVDKPWIEDTEFLQKAAQADLMIVNGEGTIHHSWSRAQLLARIGPFCRRTLRIPSILINSTFYQNSVDTYAQLADFSLVAVRDKASAVEAARFGLRDMAYCPDLSMYHDYSGLREKRENATPLRIGASTSTLKDVKLQIQRYIEDKNVENINIFYNKKNPAADSIFTCARKLASLDLLITGQFHATCFAIATRTPFVSITSNTPKIENLLTDAFGSTRRVMSFKDVEKINPEEFASWTPEEEEALTRFEARRKELYGALSRAIAGVAGGQLAREAIPAVARAV
ncbi:MAG TPA: polysaccharide pyruvyl transferase family protein [Roseomonas sp.]|nr:polysaccharide pyruvyl transferase family protein [Roseomonas sp.]